MRSAIKLIKKFLKPAARLLSKIYIWVYLFFYYYLFHRYKSCIPIFLANLCYGAELVLKINPKILKFHIARPDEMRSEYFVWAGNWDREVFPLEEHEKYVMMREMFAEGKEFNNTQFYSIALDEMRRGTPLKRGDIKLNSLENISRYFKKHMAIFKDIKTNGYKLELAPQIGVVIGRDGQLIHFRQGHHGLATANILGINTVIIRIRAVHSLWLKNMIDNYGLQSLKSLSKELEKLTKATNTDKLCKI